MIQKAMEILEGGTYEIIRDRLQTGKDDLMERLRKLDEARKKVFGSTESRLIANSRIITEIDCVPADMVSVGESFILGYNVDLGLRDGIRLDDVFRVYAYEHGDFKALGSELIEDAAFLEDFKNLYTYYRQAAFSRFFVAGNYLHMVFRVSERVTDVKTFKWLIRDNTLLYQDDRSEQEYRFPMQHDLTWEEADRDMQRYGKHPHLSVLDKVYVSNAGGTLTIKTVDDTGTGEGIYSEELIHKDQTLDDGIFRFAESGNLIILKITPFQEEARHFIYNHKLQEVKRIDSIASSAILLPDGGGIIFSDGYYLRTGEYKLFGNSPSGMLFQEMTAAPNGEDFLYVFFDSLTGVYVLMSYNLIARQVSTPVICSGFALSPDGILLCFRNEGNQARSHSVQVWQTPFGRDGVASGKDGNYLYKIGNKDIVRAMADCQAVISLLGKKDDYEGLYADLARQSGKILDTYYWIDYGETFGLHLPLTGIRETALAAEEELEKVTQLKVRAAQSTEQARRKAQALFTRIESLPAEDIDTFVEQLGDLRFFHGEVISLRETRYVSADALGQIGSEITFHIEEVSQRCARFLQDESAFMPYAERIGAKRAELEAAATSVQAMSLEEEAGKIGEGLEMLAEIVSNLETDATVSAGIIREISRLFAALNRLKADIRNKVLSFNSGEAKASFAAQLTLLEQSLVHALDRSVTPEKTDEMLNRLFIQLEDLEARFGENEEFIVALTGKREEISHAFETRKNELVGKRNQKAMELESAADRICKTVSAKAAACGSQEELNAYFASDLMITRLRDLATQLGKLGDAVRSESVQTKIQSIREDAARKIRDRKDLYEDGENIIRLGNHKFAVNRQSPDLTIVSREGKLFYHLTGTSFYQELEDGQASLPVKYRDQALVSENHEIYRGAFLSYRIFTAYGVKALSGMSEDDLRALTTREAAANYADGYQKGIHDTDAYLFLRMLLDKHQSLGMFRHPPAQRAFARFFWSWLPDNRRVALCTRIKASGALRSVFPGSDHSYLLGDVEQDIAVFMQSLPFPEGPLPSAGSVASCLLEELRDKDSFSVSGAAWRLARDFRAAVAASSSQDTFGLSLGQAAAEDKIQLAVQWISSFLMQADRKESMAYLYEAAALLLYGEECAGDAVDEEPEGEISGLSGTHPLISDGRCHFHYHRFVSAMGEYFAKEVPAYETFRQEKHRLIQKFRASLRPEEFRPRVLTSFVRNRLTDQVYLPLFGDNLSRQLGNAGESRKTDRSGMLLLISPPGYGKTTLMEYLANRLGLVFMKISGPVIGNEVTSVDPDSARSSTARAELRKLSLALEMGDNVMLYLDDIQHCNPEFLQKFISLADSTRKMEGVYNGIPRTYELGSRKFCIVMAGNPYTETGEKFRIPDMLANRADIHNLGDVAENASSLFGLSLIENSAASNPLLSPLVSGNMEDLYELISMAETGRKDSGALRGNYTGQELESYLSVLRKVCVIRDMVLEVNASYIASAAMEDAYRTEPPFRLQGSYRDMNKLVAKVVPLMNEEETSALLLAHYQNESQTLGNEAEANLLKYKEISRSMNESEKERWETIRLTFANNNRLRSGGGREELLQMLSQAAELNSHLQGIKEILSAVSGNGK